MAGRLRGAPPGPLSDFIAAQPRSGCFAIIKNNFSAEYAQSEAEGILNYYSRLCFLQNCLLTQYIPPHSRTASTR